MNAIKVSGTPPAEVQAVIDGINEGLDLHDGPWANNPKDKFYQLSCHFWDNEWRIGTKYEDGESTAIYREGKWYYRESFTGRDFVVKHGAEEVVADWLCYFMG